MYQDNTGIQAKLCVPSIKVKAYDDGFACLLHHTRSSEGRDGALPISVSVLGRVRDARNNVDEMQMHYAK